MSYDRTTGPSQEEERNPRVPWGWRELLLAVPIIVFVFLLTSAVAILPLQAAFGGDDEVAFEDTDEGRFGAGLATVLFDATAVLSIYWLVRQRTGATWAQFGLRRPRSPAKRGMSQFFEDPDGFPFAYTARLVVVGFIAALIAVNLYGVLIDAAGLEWLLPDEQIPEEYFDSPWVVAMLGVGVVIAAPIAEEIFFRGFLFGGFSRYWRFAGAGLASALIFSSVHLQLGLVVPFSIIGLILAFVYYRSRSLLPAILIHAAFNSFSFVILVLYPEAR